ncbi:hypothetical protein [Colwellia psychrerythraea]|uniref:Uncharacterized protein n=1 Tax=Colwellia psychrerythraea TaxID=28229 RepID=A0A099L4U7_COLPS|nr:hypothetical protein [Colwellia psychrerythraea]KGJ97460.1 hypothetical protein GAB14E_1049 [Colwellia psychrerythraea]
MIKLLEKLGQNPQRSLTLFLRGLGLFVLGLLFVALGYFYHHLWQVAGVAILSLACLISAWGYLGIFANRWLNIIYRTRSGNKRSPNEHTN